MSFFLSFVISLPTLLFFSFPFVTFRSYLIFSLHVLLPRIFPSNVPSLPPDLVFSSPPHPFSSPRRLFCPSFLFSLPVFTCLLLLLISPLDHPSSSPSLSSSFHPPIPSFIFRKKWMATASSLLSPLCLCVSSSSHGHSSAPRQFSSLFLFYPPFLTFLPFHRSFQLQFIFFPPLLSPFVPSVSPSSVFPAVRAAGESLATSTLSRSPCECVCVCVRVCAREICQHPLPSSRGFVKERQADSN